MQLPNMMLQPGTYVIKLADSTSNRHIVQFYDKDEKHLVTSVLAIPNERLRLSGKSVFAFWEVPAGHPKALRAWFYPGDNFGQEFAYPKQEAAQITAANSGATVPIDDSDNNSKSATATAAAEPAPATSPEPAQTAAAQQAPVARPEPAPTAPAAPNEIAAAQQPAPATAQQYGTPASSSASTSSDAQRIQTQQQPDTLPKTASNLPWFVLVGILSIVGALALNSAYNRS